jgi:hypothetical protein
MRIQDLQAGVAYEIRNHWGSCGVLASTTPWRLTWDRYTNRATKAGTLTPDPGGKEWGHLTSLTADTAVERGYPVVVASPASPGFEQRLAELPARAAAALAHAERTGTTPDDVLPAECKLVLLQPRHILRTWEEREQIEAAGAEQRRIRNEETERWAARQTEAHGRLKQVLGDELRGTAGLQHHGLQLDWATLEAICVAYAQRTDRDR